MGRLDFSLQARTDMDEVMAYIIQDNPRAAAKTIGVFEEKARLLAANPGMGVKRNDLAPELRSFPVENYVIFYRPITDGIIVLRVLHGARDIDSLFDVAD